MFLSNAFKVRKKMSSSNFVEITNDKQFEDVLNENKGKLVVMDFTASWCGPCKYIKPHFKELAGANLDVIFLSIDVDTNKLIASKYLIRAMPTFKFYKDDVLMATLMGANLAKLKSYVATLKQPDAEPIAEGSGGAGVGCTIL